MGRLEVWLTRYDVHTDFCSELYVEIDNPWLSKMKHFRNYFLFSDVNKKCISIGANCGKMLDVSLHIYLANEEKKKRKKIVLGSSIQNIVRLWANYAVWTACDLVFNFILWPTFSQPCRQTLMAFLLLFTAMVAISILRPRTAPTVNYTSSMPILQDSKQAKKLKAQHARVSNWNSLGDWKVIFYRKRGFLGVFRDIVEALYKRRYTQ